jgi:hypothetical protein
MLSPTSSTSEKEMLELSHQIQPCTVSSPILDVAVFVFQTIACTYGSHLAGMLKGTDT